MSNVVFAFLLTTIAGLSTGIGGLIALFAKRTNTKFLCASLGFSAGIMIYISFMELIPQAVNSMQNVFVGNEKKTQLYVAVSFFVGIFIIAFIDMLIPKSSNPHEVKGVEDLAKRKKSGLERTGILMALSIAIHNFPEGIATFAAAFSENTQGAIAITVAIAIHNIPEGIAVSVPIYHATGSRKKAFWYSFASGLAEPIGALIAYLFLVQIWSPVVNGCILASVSGIMVFISLDELLPSAEKYGEHHISIFGLVAGMMLMALSLYLL